jgi:hypothetical protein
MAAIDIQKERIKNGDIDSFFDCLADILLKFSGGTLHQTCQNFNKYFSPYMICRYISMKPQLIEFAEVLNQLQTVLSFEDFYKVAYSIIPQQRSGYIKYIKKLKAKEAVNNEEIINNDNTIKSTLFDL